MKIDYISDIHLNSWTRVYGGKVQETRKEFFQNRCILPESPGDVAVVAGDSGNGLGYMGPVEEALKDLGYPEVVIIPGNHDYYGERYIPIRVSKEIQGVKIAATPLWTCFDYNPISKMVAVNGINDFRNINPLDRVANPGDTMTAWYEADLAWLRGECADVIVTHFLPFKNSVSKRFEGDALNPYYANDLYMYTMRLRPTPKLWVHGHTHHKQVYQFGDTVVASNPIGYYSEKTKEPVFPMEQVEI